MTPSKSYRFFLNINNNIKRTPSDEDGIYTKKQIISFYSKITNFLRKSYGYETKVRIDQNVVSKWMERFEDMNNIEHDDNYRTKLEKTPEKAVKDREGAFIPDSESQI